MPSSTTTSATATAWWPRCTCGRSTGWTTSWLPPSTSRPNPRTGPARWSPPTCGSPSATPASG
ncbi:hypothetical protein B7486_75955, partial [cyanobacterium TDX16]